MAKRINVRTELFFLCFGSAHEKGDISQKLKADTHYPYIRPVLTGHMYCPYIRVLGTHYPYRRTVQLKRIGVLYGPYIRAV